MNRDRLTEQRGRHIYRRPDVTTTPATDDEGEYDDVWPVRLPSSARRYQDVGDQQEAQGNGRPGKSVIPPRSSLQGQQDISPPIHLIHGVPHVNIGGQWVEVVTHENAPPPARKQKSSQGQSQQRDTDQYERSSKPRTHWFLFVGLEIGRASCRK